MRDPTLPAFKPRWTPEEINQIERDNYRRFHEQQWREINAMPISKVRAFLGLSPRNG
jgi:hypothetical protein